jgi:hypothetical protein
MISGRGSTGEDNEPLQVQVPAITKHDLALKALETREPMRMVVLRALRAYGIKVPAKEIANRRIRRK